jgi:hypothetical protein
MSLEQVLLSIAVTILTTVVVILVVGCIFLYLIVRKVKSEAIAFRNRRGLPDPASTRSALAQVERIAWIMDSAIPIGGGHRIGVDGIIDFVPGVGDLAGVLVSAWIIYRAAECGAPQPVLMRMATNVLIDALLGAFPVLGVVADSAFKANMRNVALLKEFLKSQERAGVTSIIDIGPSQRLK